MFAATMLPTSTLGSGSGSVDMAWDGAAAGTAARATVRCQIPALQTAAPHTAALSQLSSCAVREQPYGSPSHQGGGTVLRALMASGATGACSGNGDSWATKPTAAQEQAERRPGAQLPPAGMAVLDGAAQSAARSADARRVGAVMRKVRETASRPGQAGQSPTVSPGLPSLPSTPTRVQPPAEAAPAVTVTPARATGPGGRAGPLRVDLKQEYGRPVLQEYSMGEAKSAFDRMLGHHRANGW